MYQIKCDNKGNIEYLLRVTDSAYIPNDDHNADYLTYLEWVAKGNAAEKIQPTPEQIQAQLTNAVQHYLDNTAKSKNYDSILSLASYATSHNPKFAAEGQAGFLWRDAVWETCYALLDEVMSGQREIPAVEELIALLPTMEWPS